jgi:hypothetical protein
MSDLRTLPPDVEKVWVTVDYRGFSVVIYFLSVRFLLKKEEEVVEFNFTHRFTLLIHTFLTARHAFEQGFLVLSTPFSSGYYYYLYIDETRSQTNHITYPRFFGLSNSLNTMKDFQLKKLRATA